jgi:hypothetical protein
MLSPRPQDVRELVQRTFEDLDVAPLDWCELKETLLIDQGRYVARSYRLEGYMAMWLVSVGILQFYDEEGNMLRTINLLLETEPERLAA